MGTTAVIGAYLRFWIRSFSLPADVAISSLGEPKGKSGACSEPIRVAMRRIDENYAGCSEGYSDSRATLELLSRLDTPGAGIRRSSYRDRAGAEASQLCD